MDYNAIAMRTAELLGGHEAFMEMAEREHAEMQSRWNQNVEVIGRILRSHLYVEHYMTEYLSKANPRLGSLREAKLTFAQKLNLLDSTNPAIARVLPGIKRLNKIRNQLAHNLDASVTNEDAAVFLNEPSFNALRVERFRGKELPTDPLFILEEFCFFASIAFTHEFNATSIAMSKAIDEQLAKEFKND